MSNLTPYEQDLAKQLSDLPLPDENQAWEEMKQMLDKDDDRAGGAIPPSGRRGGMRWGLPALLLFLFSGVLWFFIHAKNEHGNNLKKGDSERAINVTHSAKNETSNNKDNNKPFSNKANDSDKNNNNSQLQNKNENLHSSKEIINEKLKQKNDTGDSNFKSQQQNKNVATNYNRTAKNISKTIAKSKLPKNKNLLNTYRKGKLKKRSYKIASDDLNGDDVRNIKAKRKKKKNTVNINVTQTIAKNDSSQDDEQQIQKKNKKALIFKKAIFKSKTTNSAVGDLPEDKTDSDSTKNTIDTNKDVIPQKVPAIFPQDTIVKKDTSNIKPSIEPAKDSSVAVAKKKDDKKDKKRKSHWAAGVSEQQPVRLDCHCVYPGNTYTATTTFTDYLPSLYVRFYSTNNKWFAQGEFKYAAPQYVNEFLYRTKVQNLPLNYTTTSYVLKKTYYHQLPLSFNYFVLPHFSIGTGFIYNIFSAATSQVDVRKKLYGIGNDSLISSTIIKDKNDSNFLTLANNIQMLLEMQYQWKHFSFGARYAFGLQPYAKYTEPYSNQPADKKNTSLNIFIRYELWKQGK